MRLVGYLRVSTERQVERGFGLEVQEESIKEWAAAHGHELVAILRDAGISGTREAADRPGLSEALSALEDGEAEGLVVARLDRLARTLVVQEGVLGKVWSMGGRVFSADVGEVMEDDPDDPMRTALRQMVGVFAQMERGMIAARLRAGRRQKHAGGGYAYGSPGYGFRAQKGALVPVPEEQRVIVRMAQLRAEGLTLRALATQLDAKGLQPRRGSRWDASTVGRILGRLEKETALAA